MFNTDHNPPIGKAEPLAEGVRVVTAPNASAMTFTGTRSYILGEGEVAVIDPGPDNPAHFAALCTALHGQRVSHILVTHSHIDHSPLARRLSRAFDAPVLGFGASGAGMTSAMQALQARGGLAGGEGVDHAFAPDTLLEDGAHITGAGWVLKALHTPGHMSNHMCFAWGNALFSGDHVMGWSTTLVSPPDGDLTQFMASLERLKTRPEHTYYPGHGAPLLNARTMLDYQINHRHMRETQILAALDHTRIPVITAQVYKGLDPRLLPMARRNVFAHLIDLCARGEATTIGPVSFDAVFLRADQR